MRENFGQFSEERNKKLSMEQQRSPRLLVSEHGMNSKVRCGFISAVLCTLTLSTRASLVMVYYHKIPT